MTAGAGAEPGREDREALLDRILGDYLVAQERGEAPSREDLLARHPELAGELERFLAGQREVEGRLRSLKSSEPAPPALGARSFGDYEILEEISSGGMGVVYRARQRGLNRVVALKMLLGGRLASGSAVKRFRREAEAIARLDHPNIVPVYEVGEHEGCHYYAMKYLPCGSLAQRREPFADPRSVARFLETVARAVHFAHQGGILHRDLKPANILIDQHGEPLVGDFGLAAFLDTESSLTQTGQPLGTPSYMAPEQAAGSKSRVSAAADIYSLGAILYELLAGRPPFSGDSSMEVLRNVMAGAPPRPGSIRPGVPRALETICLKCLARQCGERYLSARELADDLRRFQAGESILARKASFSEACASWCRRHPAALAVWVLLISTVLLMSALAFLWRRERNEALHNLGEARLSQARALRRSGGAGQRFEGLRILREAVGIRPDLEVRNECIACLSLTDLERVEEREGVPPGTQAMAVDRRFERGARCDADGAISIFSLPDHAVLTVLQSPVREVRSLRFAPRGPILAALVGPPDGPADCHFWDWERGVLLRRVSGGASSSLLEITPDGRAAVVAGKDRLIVLRELSPEGRVDEWPVPRMPAFLRVDPGGGTVAIAFLWSSEVEIRDLASGALQRKLPLPAEVKALAWHPDGIHLVAGCTDMNLYFLDTKTAERVSTLWGHVSHTIDLAFNGDGSLLASVCWDGTLRLWHPFSGLELVNTICPTIQPGDLEFDPSGRRLGSFRSGSRAWSYSVLNEGPCRWLNGMVPQYVQVGIHRDGRLLATLSQLGSSWWDLKTGSELSRLPVGKVYGGAFDPRSGDLLLSEEDGLRRWPVEIGDGAHGELTVRVGPPVPVVTTEPGQLIKWLTVSADGRYVGAVVRGRESYGVAIDLDARAVLVRTPGSLPHLAAVAMSPGGRWLVTTEFQGGSVKIWDGRSGSLAQTLPERAATLSFSPDGKWLAVSGENDGYLLEVSSWRRGPSLFEGSLWQVPGSLSFSGDGRLLAMGEASGRMKLFRTVSGEELATLDLSQPHPVTIGCFSPDQRYYVSASFNRVLIWDLHAFRRWLRPLGLDWENSPPPAESGSAAPHLRVEVDEGPTK